jgi:hypothetical protein
LGVVVGQVLYVDVFLCVMCQWCWSYDAACFESRDAASHYEFNTKQQTQQDKEMERSKIRSSRCLYEAGTTLMVAEGFSGWHVIRSELTGFGRPTRHARHSFHCLWFLFVNTDTLAHAVHRQRLRPIYLNPLSCRLPLDRAWLSRDQQCALKPPCARRPRELPHAPTQLLLALAEDPQKCHHHLQTQFRAERERSAISTTRSRITRQISM